MVYLRIFVIYRDSHRGKVDVMDNNRNGNNKFFKCQHRIAYSPTYHWKIVNKITEKSFSPAPPYPSLWPEKARSAVSITFNSCSIRFSVGGAKQGKTAKPGI
jgi:hypothetical protein